MSGFFSRFRRRAEEPTPAVEATDSAPAEAPREGWYQRLRTGLSRSSSRLKDNIGAIFTRRKLDAESLEELEEALITADLGVETASRAGRRARQDALRQGGQRAGGPRRARARRSRGFSKAWRSRSSSTRAGGRT